MTTPVEVLLIEDNPGDARLIGLLLDQAPAGSRFRLRHALTLAAGVEMLRQQPVDVIVLDLGLPDSSGLETVQRLAAYGSRLPALVVMSGLDDENVAVEALQAGAQDYLIKGHVDAPQLARAIRYAIGRHQAEQALTRELERARELADERAIRRQAETESEALRKLLDEREGMLRERGELLEVLAHEVRQPLHSASAALQAAQAALQSAGSQLPQAARSALQDGQHVLDQVVATLNNTLAAATLLAGSTPSSMAEVDLDALVGLVVADIGPEARKRVVVESASELRTVQLQPTTMRLALTNLLFNALSYSPPDSPVRLRVTDADLAPALCFEVIDEGQGIAPALRRTVLEKGRRGPTARPGTGAGLGLYIAQRVVDQHRGSLELLGNEPHGTIARILIPQGVDS